jgi:hypothetical protein
MKLSLAICLLLTSFNSHAALNKWVDADGKVHYSDTPPTDVKVKTLRSSAAPDAITPVSGVAAQKSLAEREAEWKKSQKTKEESAQKATQEKESAVVRQKNCEIARNNLATLENSPSIVTYNEKGERILMDDASRKQNTEEARKAVNSYCN